MVKGFGVRRLVWLICLIVMVGVGDVHGLAVEQGDILMKEGKPLDALKVYQGFLFDVRLEGAAGGKALVGAMDCLRRLGRMSEFDALCRRALALRPDDWAFAAEASSVLGRLPSYGHVRGTAFYRGDHRNSGRWVTVRETDRRFWLRELWKRHPGKTGSEYAPYYAALGRVLLRERAGRWQFWRLQLLTDMEGKLDWSRPDEALEQAESIPLGRDGQVLFYGVPKSWEAARNDGERYGWALTQARACRPDNGLEWTHARLCQEVYGVSMGYVPEESPDRRIWDELPSLSDEETVVKIGGTWHRVRVPALWNAVLAYGKLKGHSDLGRIYEGRRQYEKALAHWRACKNEEKIAQITENWCQFGNAEIQQAGRQAQLSLTFRNAESASFTAYDFDYERFMDDSIAELLKDDGQRRSWRAYHELGVPRAESDEEVKRLRRYVKGRVASWQLSLSPLAGHLDTATSLRTPLSQAGSYWVTCEVPGGKACHVLVFLRDRMVVSSPRVKGHGWQVLDAESGAPVPDVQVEFLAYERLWERLNGRSTSRLLHKRFAEVTDGDGMVVVSRDRLEVSLKGGVQVLSSVVPLVKSRSGRLLVCGRGSMGMLSPMVGQEGRDQMFFMSDRPIYRPGHTVKYAFWTGRGDYGKLEEQSAWAGRRGTLTIMSGRGKKLLEEKRVLDEFGGLSGELALDSSSDLGQYVISFRIPGKLYGHGGFRVEAYRKPEYEVKVELPAVAPLLGDRFKVKVKADYYFGAPVTEGTVSLKILRQSFHDRWYPIGLWDWLYGRGYGWLGGVSPWYRGWSRWGGQVGLERWFPFRGDRPEVVLSSKGPLGADGCYEVTVDTSRVKELLGDRDHEYRITAEVRDASRRTTVGEGRVIVARQPFQAIVWLDCGYGKVGEAMTAFLQARTPGGEPVPGKGRLTLYRVSYDEKNEPVETPERSWEVSADAKGRGSQTFSASRAGQYRLGWTVTDAKGRTVEGGVLFSMVGDGYDGRDFRFSALELLPDRVTYAPGETARLLVNTEQSGSTVMLHVQGRNEGTDKEVQVIRMKGKSQLVEIPIRQEDQPNVHVTAYTVRNGQCHKVTKSLAVPPEKRILLVEVEPDRKTFEPGDRGRLRLRLMDMRGKPVSGRLVVTVYDKSVDAVAGGSQIPDIRRHFWDWTRPESFYANFLMEGGSFRNMVEPGQPGMSIQEGGYGHRVYGMGSARAGARMMLKASAPMMQNAPMAAPVMADSMAKNEAAFDGGAAEAEETGLGNVHVRSVFADTALWRANVMADKNGLAILELPLPENLTTWRIRVWAMGSGTRVGEGEAEVMVSKRLLIRPQMPRVFREGDEMTISGIVHNYSDGEATVTVSLEESSGCLELLDEAIREVTVAGHGGQARVDWRVRVAKVGQAAMRLRGSDRSGKLSDGVECKVPSLIHGMEVMGTKVGKMDAESRTQEVVVSIPQTIQPGSGKIKVYLTPSLAGIMLDALPYLISSPDGTTDQVLSRFLPLVQVRQTLKRMGMNLSDVALRSHLSESVRPELLEQLKPVYDQRALERHVRKGMDDLAGMQCGDGGWGWFSGWGEVSTAHTTAQVVYGLLVSKDSKLGVPEQVLKRGLQWLSRYQSERIAELKGHEDWRAQTLDALVYRVLCKGGQPNEDMEDFLFRDRGTLSLRGVVLTALGLQQVQDEQRLEEMLTILMQYVRRDSENGTAWLEQGENACWWSWHGDELETLANCVQLLVRQNPQNRLASEMTVYLVNHRRHGTYWRSTRDTAACLEALTDYIFASGEANADVSVKVWLDGEELTYFTMAQGALKSGQLELKRSGDQVVPGHHVLRLDKGGRGPLYWTVLTSYFCHGGTIMPQGLELKASRRVFLLTPDQRQSPGADRLARAMAMKRDGWKRKELKNGDAVKSGDLLEVELTVTSKNDYEYLMLEDPKAAGWEPVDARSGYAWNALGAYVEQRDEAVRFYLRSLNRGTHALSYRVRAEMPGAFQLMPTIIRGVYAPELRGNSWEQRVDIKD